MFRSSARLLRFLPADGLQVVVRGRVTVYEDRGELQISAEHIEPKGGWLAAVFPSSNSRPNSKPKDLFASERKKPIPTLPSRIGVVTSTQAAALRDILNVLDRRHHSVNVLIYPAQVQGDAASIEVAAGVRFFNKHEKMWTSSSSHAAGRQAARRPRRVQRRSAGPFQPIAALRDSL